MAGKLKLYIDVAADGAIRSLEKVETETQKVEKGFSGLGSVVSGSLVAGLAAGTAALGAMAFATSKAFDALDDAGRIQGLQRSFENLQSSIGVVADSSIQSLQDATSGLVSDLGLMEAANNAVLLGVDDGTGKFAEMAEAAVKLGQATGRTALEAIGDLTTGIGRQSKLILDNLGVVVDTTAAYDKYAASIGTTADKLDDNEKKLAFQREAFAQVTAKAAELPDVLENGATAFQRLQAQTENASAEFSVAVAENDNLRDAINGLSGVIDDIDIVQLANDVADLAAAFVNLGQTVLPVVIEQFNNFVRGLKVISAEINEFLGETSRFDRLLAQQQKVTSSSSVLAKELDGIYDTLLKDSKSSTEVASKAFDKFKESIKGNSEAQKELKEDIESVAVILDDLGETYGVNTKGASELAVETEKVIKVLDKVGGSSGSASKATKKLTELEKAQRDFAKSLEEIQPASDAYEIAEASLKDYAGLLAKEQITQEKFNQAVLNLGLNSKLSAVEVKELGDEIKKAKEQAEKKKSDGGLFGIEDSFNSIFGGDALNQATGGLFDGINQELGQGITSSISNVLQDITNGGSFDNALREAGAGIGTAAGTVIGGPIGGAIGKEIGKGIGDNLAKLGESSESTVAGLFDTFVIPGGNFLGIGDKVGKALFGNSDAEANAREGFQSFFREILDANELQLVIDDQFQKLDFNITGGRNAFDGGALFDTAFEGLDENVISQFSSIGGALNDLIGTGEDLGSQFGAILADQLGGDLNNLQLLLQETGVSAEQLGDSVVSSFLAADISAIEAQSSLAAINDLFTAGIPGAEAAYGQAFDNLVNGTGRGRQALDALADQGAEALDDKLIKSLDNLEASLIAQGKPIDDVTKQFDALEAAGVTSLEGLRDISDRTGIAILANLEASSFGFEGSIDNATGKVEKLINDLENVPAEVRTKYIVDVEVRGDSIPEGAPGLG